MDEAEIDRVGEFMKNAYVHIPDGDFDVREYFLRWHDYIEAHDGCPISTAEHYSNVKRLAIKRAQDIFYNNLGDENIWEAVYNDYKETMTKEFLQKYIQHRWQSLVDYKKKTSVMSQALYADYLEAQDIDRYLDFQKASIDLSLQN
ncbi:MAG: hypothetical protein WBA74_02200 [Cyclobacteriaceae bacterium]